MELDFNVLIWPILCILLIVGLVIVKVVVDMRANAPAQQKKGFNATSKRRDFGENVRSWNLPGIPGLDLSDETRSMILLVGLGIVGFAIVVFLGFNLATMQWLDEDGHPVSMPSWIWPLLCVLIGVAALSYNILAENKNESVTTFRPAIPAPTASVKASRPTGFNKQGKFGNFNKKHKK